MADAEAATIEKGKVPENQEGGAYRAARLDRLRRRIRPLVLRRTKELVAADLPAKQEQEVRIELAQLEQTFSEHVLDATAAYELLITDGSRLEGVPDSARREDTSPVRDAACGVPTSVGFPIIMTMLLARPNGRLQP